MIMKKNLTINMKYIFFYLKKIHALKYYEHYLDSEQQQSKDLSHQHKEHIDVNIENYKWYEDIIKLCDQRIQNDPHDKQLYELKSQALEKLKQYDKSISCLNEGIQHHPNAKDLYKSKEFALHHLNILCETAQTYLLRRDKEENVFLNILYNQFDQNITLILFKQFTPKNQFFNLNSSNLLLTQNILFF